MVSETPRIPTDNKLFSMLRERIIEDFNRLRIKVKISNDLRGLAFRGIDLRGLKADGLNFSNSKFKQLDLRGRNFTNCKLDGASLYGAKISGCLFLKELSQQEILMSVSHGTRLRVG